MAIIGWLKIWLAGAFYQGFQPDLLIFQGDLYNCYKKIWLENIFRVFKMSNVYIKRDLENLIVHTTKTERNLERELGFVSVGHSSHPLMIELDWFVFLIKALKQDQECVFLIEIVK